MKSGIYEGWVRHRRFSPSGHQFRYRVFMPYLRLDELPELFDVSPLWSARRWAPARWRRSDYLGDPSLSLDEAVRRRVEEQVGQRPTGPIYQLANLRYFGYIMNPISCYYCFSEDEQALEYLVAEVENTPWRERHSYVLEAQTDRPWLRCSFDKQFHVSPFQPMTTRYHWHSNTPGEKLVLHMSVEDKGSTLFDASLSMSHQPATAANLNRHLLKYPLMTARVGTGIYWQALRLWLKSVPFFPHPNTQETRAIHE